MKTFPGVRALDGMNLRLRKGTVHVICGENGAGKSVMMKIINGTLMTDSLGQVSFETMMDTAAELGIETLEITTGGYSSAPHLEDVYKRQAWITSISGCQCGLTQADGKSDRCGLR